jgi:hypothetical protein
MNTSLFVEETVKEKLQTTMDAFEAAEEGIPRLANVVEAVCKKQVLFSAFRIDPKVDGTPYECKYFNMNAFMTYCGTPPDTKRR